MLGFLGAVSLVVVNPGGGAYLELSRLEQIVLAKRIGIMPLIVFLVTAFGRGRKNGAVLAVVLPDRCRHRADKEFFYGFLLVHVSSLFTCIQFKTAASITALRATA